LEAALGLENDFRNTHARLTHYFPKARMEKPSLLLTPLFLFVGVKESVNCEFALFLSLHFQRK
jgi:hypothetical protein